jgi:hypothetical protein
MTNEHRKAQNRERSRKWRAANPERVRERHRAWRAANPEKDREYTRAWREGQKANPQWLAQQRERAIAWNKAHPEETKAHNRAWYIRHRERICAARRVQRAAARLTAPMATVSSDGVDPCTQLPMLGRPDV